MAYERFDHLPLWQAAIEMAAAVIALTEKPPFHSYSSLRNQIERAAVAVSNNIAEGFERGTKQDFIALLGMARGSTDEVRSMLCLLEKMPATAGLASDILNVQAEAESVSKQLAAWVRTLRDADLKSEHHAGEKTFRAGQAARERREFLEEMDRIRRSGRPVIPDSKLKMHEGK